MKKDDTIFALATPIGRGSVSIIRLSGRRSSIVLEKLIGSAQLPPPRKARLYSLQDPVSGEILDRGLVLWFPSPNSFTGEDIIELQVHGSLAVIKGLLGILSGISGLRPAEPGEFSRRAVLNGRMDLIAAEGLADLVAAETAVQRQQALYQMDGTLSNLYRTWRDQIIKLLAYLEAIIDFPDEDLPADIATYLQEGVKILNAMIQLHLDDDRRGEKIRSGIYIAIIGSPNVGKSSLLNYLVKRDAAIVSTTAGTTRDIIEVSIDFRGYPVVFIDTAGLRTQNEEIEAVEEEGIRRALARAATADLKLIVLNGETWPVIEQNLEAMIDDKSIVVLNKIDLFLGLYPSRIGLVTPISVLYGLGLFELEQRLQDEIKERWLSTVPTLTRTRHRVALQACLGFLGHILNSSLSIELMAENLRLAAQALEKMIGHITADDVLDIVFQEFCIGK